MNNHVMIDLETLGTRYNAPIIAIGAVRFDPTDYKPSFGFYTGIDIDDALRHGVMSGSTFAWWMRQSDEARIAAIAGQVSLHQALSSLQEFIKGDDCVWGNGATFDISIMEYAYDKVGLQVPWGFRGIRDCRTIEHAAEGLFEKPPFYGVKHNAFNDACHQAQWVSAAWMALRNGR